MNCRQEILPLPPPSMALAVLDQKLRGLELDYFPDHTITISMDFSSDVWNVRITIDNQRGPCGHVISSPGLWLDKAVESALKCAQELGREIKRQKAAQV
jgi:hypothetical protein